MKPLQTHGLTTERWLPPKTRFVTYQASDESWARYCGIGTVEVEPVALYDVRDETMGLVGYTRHKPPADGWETRIPFAENANARFGVVDHESRSMAPPEFSHVQVETVTIGVRGEYFLTWRIMLADAPKLIMSKWIECIGEDHIKEFEYRIKKKLFDRQRSIGM